MLHNAFVGQRDDGCGIAFGIRVKQDRHRLVLMLPRELSRFCGGHEPNDRTDPVRQAMDLEVAIVADGKQRRGQCRRAREAEDAIWQGLGGKPFLGGVTKLTSCSRRSASRADSGVEELIRHG